MSKPLNPAEVLLVRQKQLLAWYQLEKRDLPWRRTRKPYEIWLSEVMLQQTTVQTVIPRWKNFLEKFPTVQDLANAPEEAVLAHWTGLGYYARARNLHKAAKRVVKDFGGELPDSFELLLALPGMGRYTAAAVASIAFAEPVAVLDANVERVLTRWEANDQNIRLPAVKKQLWNTAQNTLVEKAASDWNQAMMELGALICTSRKPLCPQCPVSEACQANALGEPTRFPNKGKEVEKDSAREVALLITNNQGQILAFQRPEKGSFALMWELPKVRCTAEASRLDEANALFNALNLGNGTIHAPLQQHKHVVMNTKISLTVHPVSWSKTCDSFSTPRQYSAGEWLTIQQLLLRPLSSTQQKVLSQLSHQQQKEPELLEKEIYLFEN
ncbi:MAG: A/G-specific adenine glycosylase [Sumerlaeia bacterium]